MLCLRSHGNNLNQTINSHLHIHVYDGYSSNSDFQNLAFGGFANHQKVLGQGQY